MIVNYSKSLHNKSRCLNIMKSFLTFKITNTPKITFKNHQHSDVHVFSKSSYSEIWQNTQFTTAILFCFIHRLVRLFLQINSRIILDILWAFLIKTVTIIPLVLVGHEMIIANSGLDASLAIFRHIQSALVE